MKAQKFQEGTGQAQHKAQPSPVKETECAQAHVATTSSCLLGVEQDRHQQHEEVPTFVLAVVLGTDDSGTVGSA